MATKSKDSTEEKIEKAAKPEKLYVQSIVGPMLDFETNKFISEPAYHLNTLYLKSQMAAGKIVLANPDD